MSDFCNKLTVRELTIATSGIDTVDETFHGDEQLAAVVHASYPAPDDHPAWQAIRARGALSTTPLEDERLSTIDVQGVECRVITPRSAPTGTYLHFHGGGWSFGSHFSQDARMLALSEATGLRVISVGYRLAPEHPITDAIADCAMVATAVAAEEESFLGVGGESAGAHLSVLALLAARDADTRRFDAAVLTYGCFDLAGTPSRRTDDRYRTLNAAILPGADDERLRQPTLSPLYADLTGLPPARFLCGTRDPLLDDTLMLEARWRSVAETELDLVAGAHHAFTLAQTETTRRTHQREHAFLRRHLARRATGVRV